MKFICPTCFLVRIPWPCSCVHLPKIYLTEMFIYSYLHHMFFTIHWLKRFKPLQVVECHLERSKPLHFVEHAYPSQPWSGWNRYMFLLLCQCWADFWVCFFPIAMNCQWDCVLQFHRFLDILTSYFFFRCFQVSISWDCLWLQRRWKLHIRIVWWNSWVYNATIFGRCII